MRSMIVRASVLAVAIAFVTLSAAACCSVGAVAKKPFVGDVTIAADGSVVPANAPIRAVDGVYFLQKDMDGTVYILKDDIVLDGNGYSIMDIDGTEQDYGVKLEGRSGVTVRNLSVSGTLVGVDLVECQDCAVVASVFEENVECVRSIYSKGLAVVGNTILATESWAISIGVGYGGDIVSDNVVDGANFGIWVDSEQAFIERNLVTRCIYGISLVSSFNSWNSVVSDNEVSCGPYSIGIWIGGVYGALVEGNVLHNNGHGIWGFGAIGCNITGNEISGGDIGVILEDSYDCCTFGNDFVRNKVHAVCDRGSLGNVWDDGARGNYWSQYDGVDENLDGVGDTPFVIDEDDLDRYPLMDPVA